MDAAWLFPGQGSQFCGMGRELWSSFEPARRILEEAEDLSSLPLGDYMRLGPADVLMRTDVLQPAVTAMNIGCALMLTDAGYLPAVTAGHSLGEFAALFAAGVLTASEALNLVVQRGRIMRRAAETSPGAMLAVKGVAIQEIEAILSNSDGNVCIANYNSPSQIIVSGPLASLAGFSRQIRNVGGQTVELPVAGAWHSSLMDIAAGEFARVLDSVRFLNARCPVFTNVTGQPETNGDRLKDLSKRQLNAPVQWLQTVCGMRERGVNKFLEVGPGKVLRGLLRQTCPDQNSYSVRSIEGLRSLGFLRDSLEAEQTA